MQRGPNLRKLPQISVGNLQKLRKPAEAYGNPTEDSVAKPCENLRKSYGSLRKPAEAYGKPTEDLVAHTFFWGNFFFQYR